MKKTCHDEFEMMKTLEKCNLFEVRIPNESVKYFQTIYLEKTPNGKIFVNFGRYFGAISDQLICDFPIKYDDTEVLFGDVSVKPLRKKDIVSILDLLDPDYVSKVIKKDGTVNVIFDYDKLISLSYSDRQEITEYMKNICICYGYVIDFRTIPYMELTESTAKVGFYNCDTDSITEFKEDFIPLSDDEIKIVEKFMKQIQ